MLIVEYKYNAGHVWRHLFASRWDDVPAGVQVDRVIFSPGSDWTPESEARCYARLLKSFCEFCRVVAVDSIPHKDWTPFYS